MILNQDEAVRIIKERDSYVEFFKFHLCTEMTLNKVSRCHHYKIAHHKRVQTALAELDCRGKRKFNGKVWVELFYFLNRSIDPMDNLPAAVKPIFDGMQNAEVIKTDSTTTIQSPIISWCVKFNPKQKYDNCVIILMAENPILCGKKLEIEINQR